jgi:hypothetical protein
LCNPNDINGQQCVEHTAAFQPNNLSGLHGQVASAPAVKFLSFSDSPLLALQTVN